jgi:phosphohistidine phosphatase
MQRSTAIVLAAPWHRFSLGICHSFGSTLSSDHSPMQTRPGFFYRQSGVVPLRRTADGLEILMITTRRSGRWTIPKGVVEVGISPRESAVKEAYEEAGVRGRASEESVGSYHFEKWGSECTVEVFLLDVDEVLSRWPEALDRRRRWMSVRQAAASVRNEELRSILSALEEHR